MERRLSVEAIYIKSASKLNGVAIEYLLNRAYSWGRLAWETGRSVNELERAWREYRQKGK